MKMVYSIHTAKKKGTIGHSTQQKAGGNNTIYGISWSPNSDEIACICGKGDVKVFRTKKGTLKSELRPGSKGFRVAWNQLDPRYILSSSNDGKVYLLTFSETGELVVHSQYPHEGSATYGVSWHLTEPHMFATGADDGNVRIFDIQSGSTNCINMLKGHTARVFNIVWHPHSQHILASGSNDKTIRVWNINENSSVVLQGHEGYVRGLVWSNEIPWFLASGSWDSKICIWDTRIGSCIAVLEDHHADIYGLDSHPERPFVFVSCSRDNSIRFWNSEGLVNNFKIQSILRYNQTELLDEINESSVIPKSSDEVNFSSVTKM